MESARKRIYNYMIIRISRDSFKGKKKKIKATNNFIQKFCLCFHPVEAAKSHTGSSQLDVLCIFKHFSQVH